MISLMAFITRKLPIEIFYYGKQCWNLGYPLFLFVILDVGYRQEAGASHLRVVLLLQAYHKLDLVFELALRMTHVRMFLGLWEQQLLALQQQHAMVCERFFYSGVN
jgi:hypothetical protein